MLQEFGRALLNYVSDHYAPPASAVQSGDAVFDEKQEELDHYETMMGVPRGRLAVTMDAITDAMALVGQHGVYCQSQRWPGKPVMDIQIIMKSLTDAKELIQSVMEELKNPRRRGSAGRYASAMIEFPSSLFSAP